jgi:hypothetical protein
MMGGVSDELVLVTRPDREVVVWEYGGGSCLYFLVRNVAYFWALNVTLSRTPVAGFRGAFFRKVWHQSTTFRARSSPLCHRGQRA